jgi:hypothetical protein
MHSRNLFAYTLLFIAGAASAYGQAIVNFGNHSNVAFTATADRQVYLDYVGGTPLVGLNYGAQLYYGRDATSLTPATPPARFRALNTLLPGTWAGGNRTLLGFNYGDTVILQVRVWDMNQFPTFEHAAWAGGVTGVSAPFQYLAGTPSQPPSAFVMENFRAFALGSPPPFVNEAPRFTGGQNITVAEDALWTVVTRWAKGMTAGPPSEVGQSLSFSVSNSAPTLFSIQPSILANGDLWFKPATDAHGNARVTVWLHDNGGTANGGRDTSDPQFFDLTITAVNDAPTALLQSVTVNEDATIAITLMGIDVEGDTLGFTSGAPGRGTNTYHNGIVLYTPPENYFGEDSFSFMAFDGQAESEPAVVRITVRPVNDAPVARAGIEPLLNLSSAISNTLVLSLNGSNAAVVLGGSESFDIDNASIEHLWFEGVTELAHGPLTTNAFALGPHSVSLVVSDGELTASTVVDFEVISLGDAINVIVLMLDSSSLSRSLQRPLVASLKAAAQSFENSEVNAGTNQLAAFLRKLDVQLGATHPELVNDLRTATQGIIDAIESLQVTRQ